MDDRLLTGPVEETSGGSRTNSHSAASPAPGDDPGAGPTSAPDGQRQHQSRADGASRRSGASGQSRDSRESQHVPSRQAILAALIRLPQLVAAGLLSIAQSNAMVQALRTVLQHLPPEAAGEQRAVEISTLQDVLRERPDLLRALEPLLSPEQLAELADVEEADD